MPALDRLPAAQAIAAMQSINKLAVTPAFMLAFLGIGDRLRRARRSGRSRRAAPAPAAWVLAGSACSSSASIGVSFAANIPLNDTLDGVDPHAADAAARWSDYYASWMPFNHVRAATRDHGFGAAGDRAARWAELSPVPPADAARPCASSA